jgi:NADH-quinone oxidoreductase subunit M
VYLLWMFQRVMFGTNDNPKNQSLSDVSTKEMWTLLPLVVFIVWIGVFPKTFMDVSSASSKLVVEKALGMAPAAKLELSAPHSESSTAPKH